MKTTNFVKLRKGFCQFLDIYPKKIVQIHCLVILLVIFTGCKPGIYIGEIKVPYKKICGSNAKYKCRATGFGSNNPTFGIYSYELPSGIGKTEGYNHYNLGRANNLQAFNDTYELIKLEDSEVITNIANINYDLKTKNISAILTELKSSLKDNNINLDISSEIIAEFRNQLDIRLNIASKIETYTLSQGVIDGIRNAANNQPATERFKEAANKLKGKNRPLIREVIVIKEIVSYEEGKDFSSILKAVLDTKLVNDNNKVTAVLNAMLSKDKSQKFSASYNLIRIYSYGYFNDKWMFANAN